MEWATYLRKVVWVRMGRTGAPRQAILIGCVKCLLWGGGCVCDYEGGRVKTVRTGDPKQVLACHVPFFFFVAKKRERRIF